MFTGSQAGSCLGFPPFNLPVTPSLRSIALYQISQWTGKPLWPFSHRTETTNKNRSVARGCEHLFPIRHDKKKDKQKNDAHQNKTKTAEQENISIIASWTTWRSVFDEVCHAKPTRAVFPTHICDRACTRCDEFFCSNQINAHCILWLGQDIDCLIGISIVCVHVFGRASSLFY